MKILRRAETEYRKKIKDKKLNRLKIRKYCVAQSEYQKKIKYKKINKLKEKI